MLNQKKRSLIIEINNFINSDIIKQNKYFYDKGLYLELKFKQISLAKLTKLVGNTDKSFNKTIDYKKKLYEYYIDKYIKDTAIINIINNYIISNMDNYLNICILPDFEKYSLINIIYWIDNVIVKDKERKKKNDFLYDIYLYQKEENNCLHFSFS